MKGRRAEGVLSPSADPRTDSRRSLFLLKNDEERQVTFESRAIVVVGGISPSRRIKLQERARGKGVVGGEGGDGILRFVNLKCTERESLPHDPDRNYNHYIMQL